MDIREVPILTPIQKFQEMDRENFLKRYSSRGHIPRHFSDKVGFFTTNEYDYPESLNKIRVRGGLHLAVMGGIDPVLGQIAVAKPDLTIMTDINGESLKNTTKGRVDSILESSNGAEYWEHVRHYFNSVIRNLDPRRWDFPIDQDSTRHGWSSPEHFLTVKQALSKGKIKWIEGDITNQGIDIAYKISAETGVPIRLIYVSNIFDYYENDIKTFIRKLQEGVEKGFIDGKAQIIDTGTSDQGLRTEVFDINAYIQKYGTS